MRHPKTLLLAALAFWSLPALAAPTRWDGVKGRTIQALRQYVEQVHGAPIPQVEGKTTLGQILVDVMRPGEPAIQLNSQTRAKRGLSYGHLAPSDILPTLDLMQPGAHLQITIATFRPGNVPGSQRQHDITTTWKVKANGRLRLTGTLIGYGTLAREFIQR